MQLSTTYLTDYCKIYVADPEYTQADALAAYCRVHRTEIMQQLHQHGILLFRGFKIERSYEFYELIEQHLQLEPRNSITPNTQGWFATLIRKHSEKLFGINNEKLYHNHNIVQLKPRENAIQNLHIQGSMHSTRSRYVALFCQRTSTHLPETGFNDLEKIWNHFPTSIQKKYLGAWSHFSYISIRKLNILDRLLLKNSPFHLSKLTNKRAKLTLKRSPFVITHPDTQRLAIQPWVFANNTHTFAHHTTQTICKHRGSLQSGFTANHMQLSWELFTYTGEKIEWTHQEKQLYFDALYRDALLVQWQQGDIALVDNIKIAHWRINDGNESHNLLQIQANVFHADLHSAI